MKKTRNRIIRAAVCIGVGVAVLGMAVFANIDNANGYGVVKEAAKNTLFSSGNVTADMNVSADLEGSSLFNGNALIKKDAGGDVKMQTASQSYDGSGKLESDSLMTIQDGYRLSSYTYSTDEGLENHKTKYKMSDRDISEEMFTNTEVLDKQIGFLETLADTLIGDIKNNIVLTDSSDGNRTYTINMTGEQLPKYMTAAFSLFNASVRANYEYSDEIFPKGVDADIQTISEMFLNKNEPYVNTISGSVSIDNNGRLTAFDGKVVLTGYDNSGAQKNLNMVIDSVFTDYGTTSIERVNADEYEDMSDRVTTKYSIEEDGSGSLTVTQSDDEDVDGVSNGSVNLQSKNEDGTFSTYTVSSDGKLRDENGNVVTVVNGEGAEADDDAA